MKTLLVSAHNPMTGPRHLGHHISTMIDWPKLQDDHELFIVVDDLICSILYPGVRAEIYDRSFACIKEFMATGINLEEQNIVLTSMIPEVHELCLFVSLAIDHAWCKKLYYETFAGQLSTYQRSELQLPLLPSIAEIVYPQIHLATLTLGLRADFFQGGEEMRGYLNIMNEISNNIQSLSKTPEFMGGRNTFCLGIDGNHMAADNAIYISSSEEEIKSCLSQTKSLDILKHWCHCLGNEELHSAMCENEESKEHMEHCCKLMHNHLKEELACFRNSSVTNNEIIEVIEKSSIRARERLKETLIEVKREFGIPGY